MSVQYDKHNLTKEEWESPTCISWRNMKARCDNPNNDNYSNYGGKGIKVCERWYNFSNFLADMGERPKGTTLDRIDRDGDYDPDNCKWSTYAEQTRNRSISVLTLDSATEIACELIKNNRTHQDIADQYCVSRSVVTRIGSGARWPEALNLACKKLAGELKVVHAS